MKLFQFILIIILFLSACTDEDAPKDTETNRYYADYIQLYNAYDSLGNEQTLERLNEYMQEYPERKEAYVFKGYILGKMGDYAKANEFFEIAKTKDSANVDIYEYQTSFLLYDNTKRAQTETLINEGLLIDDSSDVLYNNLAWLHLFENDYTQAINDIEKALSLNQANQNLPRTAYVAAKLASNSALIDKYITLWSPEEEALDNLNTILETEGSFGLYKTFDQ